MNRPPCPICEIEKNGSPDIPKLIDEYVAMIPKAQKADPALCEARLAACLKCDCLRGEGLCAECGCYVRVRASKKSMHCPHPAGDRWR